MENIADALKMAGAALIFIIAFSVAMVMFSKARTTTDAVLDNLQIDDFFPKAEPLDANVTRVVGIETIIPTLYRYAQFDENIRIIILDEDGKELQVFDQEIESLVNSGLNTTASSTDKDYYKSLQEKYDIREKDAYMYGAPWANQSNSQYRLERINAYIYGTGCKHMPNVYTSLGNNLMSYSNRKFEEKYVEYRTGGKTYTDEFGEEIVVIPASTKIIITYKLTPQTSTS